MQVKRCLGSIAPGQNVANYTNCNQYDSENKSCDGEGSLIRTNVLINIAISINQLQSNSRAGNKNFTPVHM